MEWRSVIMEDNDYTGYYEVSSFGEVRNFKTKKILKPQRASRGYYQVALSKQGKVTRYLVQRIVALAFLPRVSIDAEVNHKNGDKSKNDVSNLEWLSQVKNMEHAFESGLHPHPKKAVLQLSLDGLVVINEFESLIEASRKTNIGVGSIHNACSGRRKTAGGFIWKFK